MTPLPVKETSPAAIISPPALIVKDPPVAFKVTVVPALMLPLTAIVALLIATAPVTPIPWSKPVVKSPALTVVVPVPVVCVKLAARTPLVVTSAALLIKIAANGRVLPTRPDMVISPVPAVIFKF